MRREKRKLKLLCEMRDEDKERKRPVETTPKIEAQCY